IFITLLGRRTWGRCRTGGCGSESSFSNAPGRSGRRSRKSSKSGRALPHRQVLNSIDEVGRKTSLGQYLQLLDELPDRKRELGSVDYACELDALSLPSCGFHEQVFVLGKE